MEENYKIIIFAKILWFYRIIVGNDILRDRSGNVFQGLSNQKYTFTSDSSAGCHNGVISAVAIGVTSGILAVILLGGIVGCYVTKSKRNSWRNNPRNFVDLGNDIRRLDEGPVTEGSMVETADGAKMQVRLVPAYESPTASTDQIDLVGVQEEKNTNDGHPV